MSASSQSYLNSALPAATLTITEVEVAPSVALGKSNILLFAVAGAALGIVLGIGAAASLSLPQRIARAHTASAKTHSQPDHTQDGKVQPAEAQAHEVQSAIAQPGPKDLGSAAFDAAGLTGRLTADWNDKATYQLAIEPANPAQQAGFSLAVAGSPKPLSVSFQLMDAKGAVLCGQEAIVRFSPSRGATAQTGSAELTQLEAQEAVRERGHDIFENEIGDEGEIAGINAKGAMPCSMQAFASAKSWSFSADFPSVAEQAELLKQVHPATAPKSAHSAKPGSEKKAEAHKLTASLESFVLPRPPDR